MRGAGGIRDALDLRTGERDARGRDGARLQHAVPRRGHRDGPARPQLPPGRPRAGAGRSGVALRRDRLPAGHPRPASRAIPSRSRTPSRRSSAERTSNTTAGRLRVLELAHALEVVVLINLFIVLFVPTLSGVRMANAAVYLAVSLVLVAAVTSVAAITARLRVGQRVPLLLGLGRPRGVRRDRRRGDPLRDRAMGILGVVWRNLTRAVRTRRPDDLVPRPAVFRGLIEHEAALCTGCHACAYVCAPQGDHPAARGRQGDHVELLRRPVLVLRPVRPVLSDRTRSPTTASCRR